jgi:intracellular septation protein A
MVRGALPAVAVATLIPLVLFYTALMAGSVKWAIGVLVGYAWVMAAWQYFTRRRVSGMLLVTAMTSSFRALVALVSGHTFMFFAIPVLETAAFGLMFVVTLLSSEPLVVRMARDLVPAAAEDLGEHRRVVRSLSWLWAGAYLGSAATTLVLLLATPVSVFVAAHTATGWLWNGAAAAVSVLVVRRQASGVFAHVLRQPDLTVTTSASAVRTQASAGSRLPRKLPRPAVAPA